MGLTSVRENKDVVRCEFLVLFTYIILFDYFTPVTNSWKVCIYFRPGYIRHLRNHNDIINLTFEVDKQPTVFTGVSLFVKETLIK